MARHVHGGRPAARPARRPVRLPARQPVWSRARPSREDYRAILRRPRWWATGAVVVGAWVVLVHLVFQVGLGDHSWLAEWMVGFLGSGYWLGRAAEREAARRKNFADGSTMVISGYLGLETSGVLASDARAWADSSPWMFE